MLAQQKANDDALRLAHAARAAAEKANRLDPDDLEVAWIRVAIEATTSRIATNFENFEELVRAVSNIGEFAQSDVRRFRSKEPDHLLERLIAEAVNVRSTFWSKVDSELRTAANKATVKSGTEEVQRWRHLWSKGIRSPEVRRGLIAALLLKAGLETGNGSRVRDASLERALEDLAQAELIMASLRHRDEYLLAGSALDFGIAASFVGLYLRVGEPAKAVARLKEFLSRTKGSGASFVIQRAAALGLLQDIQHDTVPEETIALCVLRFRHSSNTLLAEDFFPRRPSMHLTPTDPMPFWMTLN